MYYSALFTTKTKQIHAISICVEHNVKYNKMTFILYLSGCVCAGVRVCHSTYIYASIFVKCICMYVYMCICAFTYLDIYLPINLRIYLLFYAPSYLYTYAPVCLPIFASIYLSICDLCSYLWISLSIYVSIHLISIHQPMHLSV